MRRFGIACVVSFLVAGGASPRLFAADPPTVGIVNLDKVFKAHKPFQDRLNPLKQEAKDLDDKFKVRQAEFETVVKKLQAAGAGSPEFTRLQQQAGKLQGELQQFAATERAKLPEQDPATHEDNVRWMLDMLALAFQSDTTRIATFMFGNAVSGRNFSFLEDVRGGHHDISHHENDAEKLRMYQRINQWHIEQYAYLLGKLKGMKEGEGTVLDNCLILFGAGLRDGNSHSPHNLPLVLAGRGGGRLASGQHLVYERDSPLSNLYVSMLDAFGTPVERFADSTGPLAGVLA